jgi:hypothetical protein
VGHKQTYARAQEAAGKGDGFWAAFLYALKGEPTHLEIAQKWLLKTWGSQARETLRREKLLDTPEHWKGAENSSLTEQHAIALR